ncbi:unnamed protein product [Mesocestoides corti]|uniref:SCAN box domain-containing protein n=1 Tax=Mesocestoides corti TaxID=53468 RepID=A0A0R3UBT6_MESCO|nr:unnamed protein product [Mesocestoides corti]
MLLTTVSNVMPPHGAPLSLDQWLDAKMASFCPRYSRTAAHTPSYYTKRNKSVSPSDKVLRLWELGQRKLRYGETIQCFVDELYDMVSNVYRDKSVEEIKQKTVKYVILSLTGDEVRRYGHLIDRPLEEVEEILSRDPNLTRTPPVGSRQRTWQPRGGHRSQVTRGPTGHRPHQPSSKQWSNSVHFNKLKPYRPEEEDEDEPLVYCEPLPIDNTVEIAAVEGDDKLGTASLLRGGQSSVGAGGRHLGIQPLVEGQWRAVGAASRDFRLPGVFKFQMGRQSPDSQSPHEVVFLFLEAKQEPMSGQEQPEPSILETPCEH